MGNIVVVTVILLILSLSIAKIVMEKRRGSKCIGCPYGKVNKNSIGCHCQLPQEKKE